MVDDYRFRLINQSSPALPYYASRKNAQTSVADAKSTVEGAPESSDYVSGDTIELTKVTDIGAYANQVQGNAADGAASVGNPVQVAGKDGSGNVQALLTGTDGSQLIQGIVADGVAASGNPVQIGGKDGSGNIQSVRTGTDGSERVEIMDGATPVDATPVEVASGTGDAQAIAAATGLRLFGFSVRENAAGAATAILYHGTANTDPPIAFLSLASGAVQIQWFGDKGIAIPNGLYVDRLSGTTHFSFWKGVVS
jgi:hypothetical protein